MSAKLLFSVQITAGKRVFPIASLEKPEKSIPLAVIMGKIALLTVYKEGD